MTASGTRITVEVNGVPRETPPITVAELVQELGLVAGAPGIAVALNDRVVPRGSWERTRLEHGDRAEIVGAVQGG